MGTIWNLGITWGISLQNLGSWLKTPMNVFSFLGSEYFFLFLLPALYWCIEAGIGLRVAIVLLLSTSVNDSLKMAFHGPRPYWYSQNILAYAKETSFGAPSGHAQVAIGVWGVLAARLRKWWAWLIAALIVFMIGISRVYLGVHFPHDVILGWLIGVLLLWLILRFWQPVMECLKKMSLMNQVLAAFISSLIIILISLIPYIWLKSTNWQAPQTWADYAKDAITMSSAFTTAGTFFGLMAGLTWFNHQGGFDSGGLLWKRIVRFLLGAVGVLIFYLGLKVLIGLIVPDSEALLPLLLRYIRYSLVGWWMTAGAPWLFVHWKLADKAS